MVARGFYSCHGMVRTVGKLFSEQMWILYPSSGLAGSLSLARERTAAHVRRESGVARGAEQCIT